MDGIGCPRTVCSATYVHSSIPQSQPTQHCPRVLNSRPGCRCVSVVEPGVPDVCRRRELRCAGRGHRPSCTLTTVSRSDEWRGKYADGRRREEGQTARRALRRAVAYVSHDEGQLQLLATFMHAVRSVNKQLYSIVVRPSCVFSRAETLATT